MRVLILTALLALGSVVSTPAHATSQVLLSDYEHAENATTVVRGTVAEQKVVLHPEWHRPMTHSKIVVAEVLLGDAPMTLTLEQMGGEHQGETLYIPGDARIKPGEEVVLFLTKREGHWYLTAMEQSKYTVEPSVDGATLHRDLTSGFFLRGPEGSLKQLDVVDDRDVLLDDMRRLLKDLEGAR
ncbi:MAG: hypothetical protein EP330_07955 [Deltaproteobacteria bacterium]|nr:MAG: hypothetical protein EP330_07955 [Deltaproteobacteria bacterium]